LVGDYCLRVDVSSEHTRSYLAAFVLDRADDTQRSQ
jgi:hypothetical protein